MVKLLVFALFLVFVMSIAVPVHAAWWNTSYMNCRNITFNESSGTARVNEPINSHAVYAGLNITGMAITDAINQTRIVNASCNNNGSDVPVQIMNTDNLTYAEVLFYVNATANSNTSYSVYYNNTLATNPNYPKLLLDWDYFTTNGSSGWLASATSGYILNWNDTSLTGYTKNTDWNLVLRNINISDTTTSFVDVITIVAGAYVSGLLGRISPRATLVNGYGGMGGQTMLDVEGWGTGAGQTLNYSVHVFPARVRFNLQSGATIITNVTLNDTVASAQRTDVTPGAAGFYGVISSKAFTVDNYEVYNDTIYRYNIPLVYTVGAEESGAVSDTTPPNITFNSQVPADISVTNIFNQFLNISYNITDTSGINISTVKLYYKANSSDSDLFYCINGTSYFGFQTGGESFVNGSTDYNFSINDNEVYPASYNFNENAMRNTVHSAYDLSGNNKYIKIRMYNISDAKNYSFFEVFVQNQTSSSNALRVYYCNSSYSTGSPATNANCINFYNILASYPSNHTHGADSIHYVVPMPINKTSKMLGNVIVTPTSYFLLRGVAGINAWNVYYIANITRADTIQASANAGVAWSNFAGTVDAHIHQYDGTEAFHYYACANDTLGNGNCSDVRSDLIDLKGLPPSSPSVYAPAESIYAGNITINYTASASPNGYPISFYNISLVNLSEAFNLSIQSNNSLDLSYVWDSTAATDGEYYVKVVACDDQGQCSAGFSENFSIDNTPPILIISLPANATYNYDENLPLNYTVSDNIAVDKCWFNLDGGSNITIADCVNGTFDADKGSHILYMFANDTSGNLNNTEHVHFTVYSSSLAGCYELDRAGTIYFLTADIEDSDVTNCMDITANNVTLDCQGHLIDGINEESTYGIYINRGSATTTNITVKNCVLTDWRYGAYLYYANNNTVINSTSSSNYYGIYLISSSNNIIINSTSSDNSYGIYLESSSDNQIINSIFNDNDNDGISLSSSSDNQIINSTFNDNDNVGIDLGASSNNTITSSTSNSNEDCGIRLFSSSNNNTITSLTSYGNVEGIAFFYSSNNQIINSSFDSNSDYGIYLTSSNGNQIINSTSNNNSNAGISLASSSDNIIYNNLFNNTVNVGFAETSGDNNWNTTRQTGSRIYSNGTQIGGNYWTNSTGNGYSDTCTDAGKDGFCDANYTLSENNTDWLPLSDEYVLSYISIVLNFSSVGFGLLGENTTNNPAANIYQINVSTNCNAQVNFSALNPILASGSYNIPSSNMKFNYTVNTNDYPDLLSFDADRLVSVVGNDIVYPRYYLDIPANQHAGLYAGSQSITASCS